MKREAELWLKTAEENLS